MDNNKRYLDGKNHSESASRGNFKNIKTDYAEVIELSPKEIELKEKELKNNPSLSEDEFVSWYLARREDYMKKKALKEKQSIEQAIDGNKNGLNNVSNIIFSKLTNTEGIQIEYYRNSKGEICKRFTDNSGNTYKKIDINGEEAYQITNDAIGYKVKKSEALVAILGGKIILHKLFDGHINVGPTNSTKEKIKKRERREVSAVRFLAGDLAVLVLASAILGTSSLVNLVNKDKGLSGGRGNGGIIEVTTDEEPYSEPTGGYIIPAKTGLYADFNAYTPVFSEDKAVQSKYEKFLNDSLNNVSYDGKNGEFVYLDSASLISTKAYMFVMEQVKQYNPKMYEELNAVLTPTTVASIMDRESSGQINDPNDAQRDYIGPYKMGLDAMREANTWSKKLTGEELFKSDNLYSANSIRELSCSEDLEILMNPIYGALVSMYVQVSNLYYLNNSKVIKGQFDKGKFLDTYLMGIQNMETLETNGDYSHLKYSSGICGFDKIRGARLSDILNGNGQYKDDTQSARCHNQLNQITTKFSGENSSHNTIAVISNQK